MKRYAAALLVFILLPGLPVWAQPGPDENHFKIEFPGGIGNTAQALRLQLETSLAERDDEAPKNGEAPRVVRLSIQPTGLGPEGYLISSGRRGRDLEISCQGEDLRGLIYATYDLADRVSYGESLEDLHVREAPYSSYRQIVACSSNHDFYRRLLRHMPRWRMNALLLYSAFHQQDRLGPDSGAWFETYLALPITYRNHPNVRAMIEQSPDFAHVRKSFSMILEEAKVYAIDVSLEFQILSYVRLDRSGGHYGESRNHFPQDFPHLFPDGKSLDWGSQAVYDFIREQLEELFDLFPGLTGITATTDEMSAFNIGHVASVLEATSEERTDWIRRMVETVEEVCERYGKRCYWDLHGSGPTFVRDLRDIAGNRPGGLRLRAESTEYEQVFSDKFPSYPFERVKEAGDGMCDHDIHIEAMQDFPWLPNIIDRFIVRHTLAGVDAGLRGGGAMWYIYRPHYSPINSLAAINMELLSRLLWNPREPVPDIWDRWLSRRFGSNAAKPAAELLQSTHEVLNLILYFDNRNANFWFQCGFPKNLAWMMPPAWGQMIEYFQPPGTPLYSHPFSAACKERAIPMSQMRSEKRAAVQRSAGMLMFLREHRSKFRTVDYQSLYPRYLAMWYYARAAEQLVECLYNFANLHIRAYDPDCKEPRKGMKSAIALLERIHREMTDDETLYWLEPDVYYRGLRAHFLDNIPTLLQDLRFHDQVLSSGSGCLDRLPEKEKNKARQIRENAAAIHEKFERNLRMELSAEALWARTAGLK